ncbi:ABC transporter permease [Megamonas hypermegale]|uniref:ABC transporter permease n=1 Tax=Megamonas hypermegale TaxID=158847 RepID=UPI0025A40139|nr:ABC transporter permease [Megamonas hypermegale]MDM8142207.1 ABC transporter permease [Megamonas hypermegale]
MKTYIARRILHLIPILLGITLLSFGLMHTVAGDAIDVMEANRGTVLSEETKDRLRSELNLDKPFLVQYGIWLKDMVSGDMGTSYVSGKPVFSTFLQKLPATILLTITSILCTIIISFPLGIIAALNRNGWSDYLIRFFSFVGNSLPGFFVSLLLIYVFSLKLNLLPVMNTSGGWQGIILPTMTLTIAMSAKYVRQIRAVVLAELNKDYVIAAKARGIPYRTIILTSVMKVTLLSFITLLSLSVGSLLGGTAIIESIFMWDGVGKMAVDAILMRDYPIILAYVVWLAIIYVIFNLITDILYHYLDPRIRLGAKK